MVLHRVRGPAYVTLTAAQDRQGTVPRKRQLQLLHVRAGCNATAPSSLPGVGVCVHRKLVTFAVCPLHHSAAAGHCVPSMRGCEPVRVWRPWQHSIVCVSEQAALAGCRHVQLPQLHRNTVRSNISTPPCGSTHQVTGTRQPLGLAKPPARMVSTYITFQLLSSVSSSIEKLRQRRQGERRRLVAVRLSADRLRS